MTRTLEAIRYDRTAGLQVLDQLLLPYQSTYVSVNGVEDGYEVIKSMKVRGAPAIAIVAALSLAVELQRRHLAGEFDSPDAVQHFIRNSFDRLRASRPTAVNLFRAADSLTALCVPSSPADTVAQMVDIYLQAAEQMLADDVADNRAIGRHGAAALQQATALEAISVLTHCNTGALATAGFGTALGVIRQLVIEGHLAHAYCTETRPYNQGARLTAYELAYEQIPATLVADAMVGALMQAGRVQAVVVGADRVALNGDTANKIGTYQLAVLAAHHKVPFFVAAPLTSVDWQCHDGSAIVIEERAAHELCDIRGARVDKDGALLTVEESGVPVLDTVRVAAEGVSVWNPAFDVTPAALITGVITERGTVWRDSAGLIDMQRLRS